MRISAILTTASMLALAACGAESSEEVSETSETGEYRIDADSGENSMTIETPDGATSMRSGANVEPDLPDGWGIYPGAKVENTVNVTGADGGGALVTMSVEATSDAVIEHYRKQAEDDGYFINMDLTTATSRVIAGDKRDGSTFSVSVVPGADGGPAQVQLTLSEG